MSKLEELIQQYCPDGVEWKTLYSITKQFSGMTGVSNKWAEEGNCVFIDYNNVYNHTSVDTTALKIATVKSLKQNTLKKEISYLQVRLRLPMNVLCPQLLKRISLMEYSLTIIYLG